ncbi:amino acid ABC transporter permease [Ancylobacter sp. Lp-2]|uniref:amino acid ABC transporter permease n=1 Tax=Ancylobacter sp. Lp-2 TaxID=2881339 RepID=UPI001E3F4F5B|nr:amino acid ABC transporter permease [Ancylobacter sp. Lp-2]MCB4767867.1 amino acid ABC transporter permease [Ancylobacter sp. Lp-2]
MSFDLFATLKFWPEFLAGLRVTLAVSAAAAVLGLITAALLTVLSLRGGPVGRAFTTLWLAIMRGAPFIVLVYSIHFLMPAFGWRAPPIVSGLIALTAFCSAYYAEVIRATVNGLPAGQWESARAIGMSRFQTARIVIIPQLWRPALPSLLGNTITMIKESSVLSVLTVSELTYQGLIVQGQTFAPFEVFLVTAVLYWLVTLSLVSVAGFSERRFLMHGGEEATLSPIAARYLSLRR